MERLIEIADAGGVSLRTVNGGDLDLSNSSGRMLARILGSVARQESEHKGERQRRANEQRAAAGTWIIRGIRTFGYTKTGEPMEPEASMVRQAATDVLAGMSLRSIAMDWNRRGVTTTRGNKWTNLQLRRLLMNPLHAGLRTHRGKVVGPGDWDALIDEDTHKGLVAFLSDPARKPGSAFERKHMGSGVYRCGKCGGRMYAMYPHGAGRRMTYVCRPTAHVARIGAPLDDYIEMVVLGYLHDKTDAHLRLADGKKIDMGALHTKRAALQARLDDLAAMFAEGAIDGSQLRRGTSELRTQIAGVDSVLADAARTSPVANLLADGRDKIDERWQASTPDIKGKIIDELMTVTVMSAPRGVKVFNPELIDIDWKTT